MPWYPLRIDCPVNLDSCSIILGGYLQILLERYAYSEIGGTFILI